MSYLCKQHPRVVSRVLSVVFFCASSKGCRSFWSLEVRLLVLLQLKMRFRLQIGVVVAFAVNAVVVLGVPVGNVTPCL